MVFRVRFGQIRRSSRFPFFRVLDELVVSGNECACNGCEFLVVSDVDILVFEMVIVSRR